MGRLREAGFKVEAHEDHFSAKEETDADWIAEVSRRRWIILTGDKAISRDELEIDALMHGGGRGYCKPPKMLQIEFAELIVRSRAKVLRHIKQQRKKKAGPYLARIKPDAKNPDKKPGKVEKWIDLEKWQEKKRKRRTRR